MAISVGGTKPRDFFTKTLGRSALLLFSMITLIAVLLAGYSYFLFEQEKSLAAITQEREDRTTAQTLNLLTLQKQIEIDAMEVRGVLANFAATDGLVARSDQAEIVNKFNDRLWQGVDAAVQAAQSLKDPELVTAFQELRRRRPGYEAAREMTLFHLKKGTSAGAKAIADFEALAAEVEKSIVATNNALGFAKERSRRAALEANRTLDRLRDRGSAAALSTILVAMLCGVAGVAITRAWVIQPLTWITFVFKELAHGRVDWGAFEVSRHDEIGDLARAYAEFRQITVERAQARKKIAEQQLVLNENQHQTKLLADRFDTALRNMYLGLIMLDAERRLLVFNPKMASLLGLPTKETGNCEMANECDACRDSARLTGHAGAAGVDIADILRCSVDAGELNEGNSQRILRALDTVAARGEKADLLVETQRDRVLEFSLQPMADGGSLMLIEDITEKRSAEAAVHRLAYFDPLTNLPNRRAFFDGVEHALAEAALTGQHFAVLFIDLDHFKEINDTQGHGAGDELLCGVAERLKSNVRSEDVVARLGGDEFVILQRDVTRARDVIALANRVVETLRDPFLVQSQEVRVGASVGIARFPQDGRVTDLLVRNADTALYRAKTRGRSTWRFFKPSMHEEVVARAALERDLRQAVSDKTMEVYFQPIVHSDGGRISAFEALLRWRHPERGMVSPAEFIPLAEETGLIIELGAFVMEQACCACATWPHDIRVAVNLSALQFKSGDLLASVRDALHASGLAPNRLEVEITEGILLQDTDSVTATLIKLRNLGVSVSLDDFGTGYSSLSYLHSFPLDRIKVDRSFLRKAVRYPNSRTLLHGIIRLSRELDLGLVVEGVETDEQLGLVRDECATAEVQGFLFSPAIPCRDVADFLASRTMERAA